jgi:hypothetical protein
VTGKKKEKRKIKKDYSKFNKKKIITTTINKSTMRMVQSAV